MPDHSLDTALLTEILASLLHLIRQGNKIMTDLSTLTAAVEGETRLDTSVEALLKNLADQITAAGTDQAALDALVATMNSNAANLANAVAMNTPVQQANTVSDAGNVSTDQQPTPVAQPGPSANPSPNDKSPAEQNPADEPPAPDAQP